MPQSTVMLHSFVPQHKHQKQHPSLHKLAANVERITMEMVQDLQTIIKKILNDNIEDLSLEIALSELEDIEEELSEKGVDIATSLLAITELIKLTIENQRQKENQYLPMLETIKNRATLTEIIAKYIAKKTSLERHAIRHTMWPKAALIP